MKLNQVEIEDTYAEAFGMRAARLLITAADLDWARTAATVMTGFGTSVIGCNCEAGVEGPLPESTPDGRPGVRALLFAVSSRQLEEQLVLRVGQCVMTCPSTACFDDLPSEEQVKVGAMLRFFGDGLQISKRLDPALTGSGASGRRLWRIPVMDGEFVVDDRVGIRRAVAGGNFFIMGRNEEITQQAARAAVEAMRQVPGVILPFPGGVVRSGSKIGSKYRKLPASTNSPYCPTLRAQVSSVLPKEAASCLEIVVDGLDEDSVGRSMATGIRAACIPGIVRISAGNYGGKLGKFQFHLHRLLEGS
ncbi:MAG: formylmethanofuran--tetrahydromethanopterin N-formyltransferase [Acidobacteriota bacterium]